MAHKHISPQAHTSMDTHCICGRIIFWDNNGSFLFLSAHSLCHCHFTFRERLLWHSKKSEKIFCIQKQTCRFIKLYIILSCKILSPNVLRTIHLEAQIKNKCYFLALEKNNYLLVREEEKKKISGKFVHFSSGKGNDIPSIAIRAQRGRSTSQRGTVCSSHEQRTAVPSQDSDVMAAPAHKGKTKWLGFNESRFY